MTDLIAISRLTWFPRVASAFPRPSVGVRQWLGAGSFVPVSTSPLLEFEYLIEEEVADALGNDANGFGLKALESVDAILTNPDFPRASAWSAIKIYYAAFFSILFLMRLSGRGPVFLYGDNINGLRALCLSHGFPTDIRRGQYVVKCDAGNKRISLVRTPEGLGVHEGAWKEFIEFVLFLEASVPTLVSTNAERQQVAQLLSSVRQALQRKNNNNGNWLSAERNQINYQIQDRNWFPYRNALRSDDLILSLDKCDTLFDTSKLVGADDDKVFFATCSFIFGWAFSVMMDVSRRSGGERTTFSDGIHHYMARTSLRNLRQRAA